VIIPVAFAGILTLQHGNILPSEAGGITFNDPLLFRLIARAFKIDLANSAANSYYLAAWVGVLVTALNLMPVGQLDGGHVLFGSSPRLHRLLGPPISAALLALGVFTPFPGWILWGLLMGLGLGFHPPLREPEETLDWPRRALVAASLLLFVLSFSPVPLALLAG